MKKDPVCGMMIDEEFAAGSALYDGQTYFFCAPGCLHSFVEKPAKYLKAMGKDDNTSANDLIVEE
ncbi:MAG TPA: YHS domain-containing protein [Bacteroidota bacterium]|nr:YHS domain-containing protein [Bacteroidota bacterium]